MYSLLTTEQIRMLEKRVTDEQGIAPKRLMLDAGTAVADYIMNGAYQMPVAVVCGPGNNGGDGIAVARLLHLAGYKVDLVFVGDPEKRSEETRKQQEIAESYGLYCHGLTEFIGKGIGYETGATAVVDALFGIGGLRAPAGEYLEAIRFINGRKAGGAKILSIDIPSGVNADTGETPGEAVSADVTITFAYKKTGLTRHPGSDLAGKIVVKDIGIYASDKSP